MKIILYKGYHSEAALSCFREALDQEDLTIFIPPNMNEYEFVQFLPRGEVVQRGEMWKPGEKTPAPQGKFQNLNVCAGVFSSGTTKNSKLILYSKENIESSVNGIYGLFDNSKFEEIFCYPQPFHTFGLTLGYGAHYFLNKKIVFEPGTYSRKSHDSCIAASPNRITLGTPTHFYDQLSWQKSSNTEVPNSYGCIIGGAKVKKQLWYEVRDQLNISQPSVGYGASEASPGISHLPPGYEPEFDGEVGWPLEYVNFDFTEEGVKFSGPNLCAAILEEGKLIQPSSLILPDLIRVNPSDGRWIYETRLNWFLNRGGEKFSLEKIENSILNQFGFEVLACQISDPRLGEELGLLFKGNRTSEAIDQVYTFLEDQFGRKFQKNLCFVEKFPLNQNMKLDRLQAARIIKARGSQEPERQLPL